MNYKAKYVKTPKGVEPGKPGKRQNPDSWKTGPDPVRHDKYYAYLKHKAQATFRCEPYYLTWEEWEQLWAGDRWFKRGRKGEDLCLRQIDPIEGWRMSNCEVVTRREHFSHMRKDR